jgi:hypothetical protein
MSPSSEFCPYWVKQPARSNFTSPFSPSMPSTAASAPGRPGIGSFNETANFKM